MNEKINMFRFIVIVVITFIMGGISGGLCVILNPKNTANNGGIESYRPRERKLLERIGEYEQREKDRIGAENRRIEAERARIEQTEKRLGALRELNRRTSDLYEELAIEAGILQDYFYNSKREYFRSIGNNSNNSKISP
jgi:hypothetical protein